MWRTLFVEARKLQWMFRITSQPKSGVALDVYYPNRNLIAIICNPLLHEDFFEANLFCCMLQSLDRLMRKSLARHCLLDCLNGLEWHPFDHCTRHK